MIASDADSNPLHELLQSSHTETLLAPRTALSAPFKFSLFFFISNTERAFEIYDNLHHSKISWYTVVMCAIQIMYTF